MGYGIFQGIKYIAGCISDIIYPETLKCNLCGATVDVNLRYRLCSNCLNSIKFINCAVEIKDCPQGIDFYSMCDFAYSVCRYEGTARSIVIALKYKNITEMAKTIAFMMYELIKKFHIKADLIAYVPSHRERTKARGYNQAEMISRELSKLTGIAVIHSLKRVKNNECQVLFSSRERWYNVKDIFECHDNLSSKDVLIVDDVITTGATIYYSSKALKKAGAGAVTAVSFARTEI